MKPGLRSWPVLALAGVILAAAVFGGGVFAGNALGDDDDGGTGTPAITNTGNPGSNPGFGSQPPRTGPFATTGDGDDDGSLVRYGAQGANPASPESATDIARGGYGGGATVPSSYYGCEAPVGDIIIDGSIDPEAAGITPRFLGEGFQLVSISVRAEGDCDEDGQPTSGRPLVDSGWRHTESGVTVWVSQRIFNDPVANVRWSTSANVVSGGYLFSVNAWNNYYYYAGDDAGPADVAEDVEAAGILPPNGQDPDIEPVLNLALSQLAPDVAARCYYTQTEGSWADLAGFGVGDPRPAIPSGFTESNFQLFTFAAPGSDCPDNGAEAPQGDSFWAQWNGESGRSYLEVNVYRYEPYEGENWPGSLDDWGAYWTSNGYQFNVWGNGADGGLGKDAILAIAKALDPGFDEQCLITTTTLDPGDLSGIGINAPSAPDGFEAGKSSLIRRGVAAGCPDPGNSTNYELQWSFIGDAGATVEVYGWMNPAASSSGGETWGYVHDFGIEWGRDNRNFSVWGNNPNGDSMRDLVIEVALSIEPGLDIDSFNDDGKPIPLPALDAPASR